MLMLLFSVIEGSEELSCGGSVVVVDGHSVGVDVFRCQGGIFFQLSDNIRAVAAYDHFSLSDVATLGNYHSAIVANGIEHSDSVVDGIYVQVAIDFSHSVHDISHSVHSDTSLVTAKVIFYDCPFAQ